MRAPGTVYPVPSPAACPRRSSETLVPPAPKNPPNRPPARHVDAQQAALASVNRDRDCDCDFDFDCVRAGRPQLCPRLRPQSASQLIAPRGGRCTSQYSLMALTLQPRRPGYTFPRRIMHDIEGRTGNEANATLLPCASNATGHFPACCSSCHLRSCHPSRLISSHLVSFDSLLFPRRTHAHTVFEHAVSSCLSHSQGRRGKWCMHNTLSQRTPCLPACLGVGLVVMSLSREPTPRCRRCVDVAPGTAGQTQFWPHGMLSAQQQQQQELWTLVNPSVVLV